MEINITLDAPANFIFNKLIASAEADIKRETNEDVDLYNLNGYSYDKSWSNGLTGKLVIFKIIKDQQYQYRLETPKDTYTVNYQFTDVTKQKTNLHYVETITAKSKKDAANNRTAGFLLGWLRKHQFKRMVRQLAAQYSSTN